MESTKEINLATLEELIDNQEIDSPRFLAGLGEEIAIASPTFTLKDETRELIALLKDSSALKLMSLLLAVRDEEVPELLYEIYKREGTTTRRKVRKKNA